MVDSDLQPDTPPSAAPSESTQLLLQALQGVLARLAEPIQVLQTILDQAVTRTGAARGALVEVGPNGERELRVLHHIQPQKLTGPAGHYSQSIFAEVLRSGNPILIEDAMRDPRFMRQESVMHLRLVSVLCTPIRTRERIAALVYLENGRERHFRPEHRDLLVSLVTIAGPILETLQSGADLAREHERLRAVEKSLRTEAQESRDILARDWSFGRFAGRSKPVRELEVEVGKASTTDFPVLLLGESGTGKNILARVLHHSGSRSKEPFVTVFCPSLEKSMVEAELFGHKRGAFTGAVADRIGKVQVAEGGTLLLDEIGELPLETQPKLLRLLQEKTYEQVGDARERRANVRIIAATNRDLPSEVRAGRFRRDLFERLNFVPIQVPPLRERREDIPVLLRVFLDQQPNGRWIEVEAAALDRLSQLDFSWPGNVRHLEQLAVRLALEAPQSAVSWELLVRLLAAPHETATASSFLEASPTTHPEMGLPEYLARAERDWLAAALQRHAELTRAQLAEKLRISESALYKKLRDYQLSV